MSTPPGWPQAVPDPEAPEFPHRVVGWMLSLRPPDYRSHEVFRRYPVVLARLAALHADASLQAARSAYAGARRDFAGRVPPEAVAETLVALSKEGSRLAAQVREVTLVEEALAAQVREVTLVEEALAARRWHPKL